MTSNSETVQVSSPARLSDIPGERGLPIFGHTLQLVRNPGEYNKRMSKKYGPVFRSNLFFRDMVTLNGPEANEFVLMDQGKNFSSKKGWEMNLKRLFPRALLLMDLDEHKANRHVMAAAFKTGPMKGYLEGLNAAIPASIKEWGKAGSFEFYPAIKKLSLGLAAGVFFGIPAGADSLRVNQALTDMVLASATVFRFALPGTQMAKGLKGRKFMIEFLETLIPDRRKSAGKDLFSQLCQAKDEDGKGFTDQQIIDHMIFMWVAAHDTITSSVTTLMYQLGLNPKWQSKIRDEIKGLGLNDGNLPYSLMNKLTYTDYCFKEALRLMPPLTGVMRETIRDVEFGGYVIPANTRVNISIMGTQRSADHWDKPSEFDPMRFSPEGGVKTRHRFSWIPYGGGAHMCLGLHFAVMQMKVIMTHLLPHYEIKLPDNYKADYRIIPVPMPKDGMPVTLKPIK